MVYSYVDVAVIVIVEGQVPISLIKPETMGEDLYRRIRALLNIRLMISLAQAFLTERRVEQIRTLQNFTLML